MAILIPPAIFEKEQGVFDLPMAADYRQQLVGGDVAGVPTGDEIAGVVRDDRAIGVDQVAIDA